MKSRYVLVLLAITAFVSVGSFVFAQGHETGSFGGNVVAMMGNGGMMNGSGGMNDGYRGMPGNYGRSGNQQPAYGRRDRTYDTEIESLKRQIQTKRNNLARLFRSGKPDKDLVDQKINELNDLEQKLDDKLAGSR
jgi:Spy/CpxP family protein refolding chaperone